MKLKKIKEKYVKSVAKIHWAIIIGGIATALIMLALTCNEANFLTKKWFAAGSLFAFGLGFNQLVTWLEHQDWEEGATALLVAIGVGYTILLISMLIGCLDVQFWCFAASGTPMAVGSWIRYAMRRKRERQEATGKALKGLDK
jgi:hypothetical protein